MVQIEEAPEVPEVREETKETVETPQEETPKEEVASEKTEAEAEGEPEGEAVEAEEEEETVVDLLGNGKVIKHIITKGSGDHPQIGDEVTVHYVGTLKDGTEFDSSRKRGQPFVFQVGVQQVIKGWDVGVMAMKRGETSKLVIQSDFGYGDRGAPPTIPPNAELTFEVELISFAPKRKEKRDMTTEERLATCQECKAAGNSAYAEQNYHGAIVQYRDAIDMLEGYRNWPDALLEQAAPLFLSSNLNLAICCAKIEAWREATLAASAVLTVDKDSVKALYWRGQAYMGLGEFQLAQADLTTALTKEPSNAPVRAKLEKCKALAKRQDAQARGLYQKMFK